MVVHARVDAALALFYKRMRGHSDDRKVREMRMGPKQFGCGDAIHHRHLNVHQDHVKRRRLAVLGEELDRLAAVIGNGDDGAGALQEFSRDLLVHFVVFDQQDADSGGVMFAGFVFPGACRLIIGFSHTKKIDQGVVEERGVHWLEQIAVHPDFFRLLPDVLAAERSHHHNFRNILQAIIALDNAAGLETVHGVHVPVHEHQPIGILRISGGNFPDGIFARSYRFGSERKAPEHLGENRPGLLIVVDNQGPDAGKVGDKALLLLAGSDAEPCREVELAAHARFALRPDGAFHHLHQAFAYGEPEAGAAVFSGGGRVGLRKRLKEARALLRRHADPTVANRELQLDAVLKLFLDRHDQHYLAVIGELDRVVDQVDEDLTETQRITHQVRRNIGLRGDQELELLVLSLVTHNDGEIVERIFKLKFGLLDIQLAGFDLGEVQNVVDDAQQGLGGGLHLVEVVACLGDRSVFRARWVMPRMAFMGVRISWLMLARKSDLARVAASAVSLAARSSAWASRRSVMSRKATTVPTTVSPFMMGVVEYSTGTDEPSFRHSTWSDTTQGLPSRAV